MSEAWNRSARFIGTHLASLNLFRESDGTVEITVARMSGSLDEWLDELTVEERKGRRPIDYCEDLIILAAGRLKARRESR